MFSTLTKYIKHLFIITDWHRYNLKRKVAELPPVKEADFANRMVKHEEQRKALNGETKVRF